MTKTNNKMASSKSKVKLYKEILLTLEDILSDCRGEFNEARELLKSIARCYEKHGNRRAKVTINKFEHVHSADQIMKKIPEYSKETVELVCTNPGCGKKLFIRKHLVKKNDEEKVYFLAHFTSKDNRGETDRHRLTIELMVLVFNYLPDIKVLCELEIFIKNSKTNEVFLVKKLQMLDVLAISNSIHSELKCIGPSDDRSYRGDVVVKTFVNKDISFEVINTSRISENKIGSGLFMIGIDVKSKYTFLTVLKKILKGEIGKRKNSYIKFYNNTLYLEYCVTSQEWEALRKKFGKELDVSVQDLYKEKKSELINYSDLVRRGAIGKLNK